MQAETAPIQEQRICVGCGFCCDGTLFAHAVLNPGEKGNLPEKIEENVFSEGGRDYFRLPCRYFNGRCTIYDIKRADVCGSYRCQLLKDLSAERISFDKAIEMVEKAMEVRNELLDQYGFLTGGDRQIPFMELLKVLGKNPGQDGINASAGMEYEMLLARCNIFEALLIKHFRSSDDFEKLVMR